jgi:hypothetical protein
MAFLELECLIYPKNTVGSFGYIRWGYHCKESRRVTMATLELPFILRCHGGLDNMSDFAQVNLVPLRRLICLCRLLTPASLTTPERREEFRLSEAKYHKPSSPFFILAGTSGK